MMDRLSCFCKMIVHVPKTLFCGAWVQEFVRAFIKALPKGIKRLPEVFRILLKLPRQIQEFLRLLCRFKCQSRDRNCEKEIPIPPDTYKRADPLLYSQQYLMKMGLAVTWGNPDIQLFRDGIPVSSSQLEAGREYEVVVRVWNNSYDAPAAGLPVYLFFLSFGVGTVATGVIKSAGYCVKCRYLS